MGELLCMNQSEKTNIKKQKKTFFATNSEVRRNKIFQMFSAGSV